MNLKDAKLESLSNDELNFLAAEARGFEAVGYYGPNKPCEDSCTHQDYQRFDTKAEAIEVYRKYWTREEPGFVNGYDMEEDDIGLSYWKQSWGPLICPCPADGDKGLDEMTFEQWFFEQHTQFNMTVLSTWLKGKMDYSVDISHDTHEMADAWFSGDDEHRLRTLTILDVLKKLAIDKWAKKLTEDVVDAND